MYLKNRLRMSILFILSISTLMLALYTGLNKKILLTIDGQTVKINTISNTVESFLINENINLKQGCRISPSIDTKLKDNMEVVVTNPFKINIVDGNNKISYKTNQETVKGILKECNIILTNKDILNKKLSDRPKSNDKIVITRVKEDLYKIIKETPFEVEYIKDAKILQGEIKNDITGENGKIEVIYKVTYKNGKETSKEKISEKIIKEPKKEVVRKGTLKANTI